MALQAQQIVSLACATAKVPSWTSQAGQLLNVVLQELCQDYDLAEARKSYSFNFASVNGSGPYSLPTDWLRADRDDVFYTISGVKYVMIPVALAEYNALVQQAGLNAYPENYAVDNAPLATQGAPQMYVWPPAAGAYPVTAVYYSQMADIATPETSSTVPWFPNTLYLLRRLAGELLLLSNDDRAPQFLGGVTQQADGSEFLGAAAILDRYLKNKDDSQVTHRVTLDRRFFGNAYNKLKNTKTIGW